MTTRKIFSMIFITIIMSAAAMAQSSDQSSERRARVIERLMKLRQFGGVQTDMAGGQIDAAPPQASDQPDAGAAFTPRADAEAAFTTQGKKFKTPAGSWLITVTFSDGSAFMVIETCTEDGTIVGAGQGDVCDGLAVTTHHGGWIKTGDRQFSATYVLFAYNTGGDQELLGTAKWRVSLSLNSTGDEWTGPFKRDVFDADGNPILPLFATGTMRARRITVEPLP